MITVTIEEEPVGIKDTYPMLKIAENGEIVLFTNGYTGTLIKPSEVVTRPIGLYADNWIKPNFRPFTGKVTLSNL